MKDLEAIEREYAAAHALVVDASDCTDKAKGTAALSAMAHAAVQIVGLVGEVRELRAALAEVTAERDAIHDAATDHLVESGPCDDADENEESGMCSNADCTYCAINVALLKIDKVDITRPAEHRCFECDEVIEDGNCNSCDETREESHVPTEQGEGE